ncbi:MAG: hypothetical protein CMM87_01640 [Rickettsiales bacterium]|nr:hypothetical protein [Rickettsiales bacterium]
MGQSCSRCNKKAFAVCCCKPLESAADQVNNDHKSDTACNVLHVSRMHPHQSMAGDLITPRRSRKTEIMMTRLDDYIVL